MRLTHRIGAKHGFHTLWLAFALVVSVALGAAAENGEGGNAATTDALLLRGLLPVGVSVDGGASVAFQMEGTPAEAAEGVQERLASLVQIWGVTDPEAMQVVSYRSQAVGGALGVGRAVHAEITRVDHPAIAAPVLLLHLKTEGDFAPESVLRIDWMAESVAVLDGANQAGLTISEVPGGVALLLSGAEGAGAGAALAATDGPESIDAAPRLHLWTEAGVGEWWLYAIATELSAAVDAGKLASALADALAGEALRGILASVHRVSPQEVAPGMTIEYTLELGNIGVAPLREVAIRLPLPAPLDLHPETLQVSGGLVSWEAGQGVIEWSVDVIPMGNTELLTFRAVVR